MISLLSSGAPLHVTKGPFSILSLTCSSVNESRPLPTASAKLSLARRSDGLTKRSRTEFIAQYSAPSPLLMLRQRSDNRSPPSDTVSSNVRTTSSSLPSSSLVARSAPSRTITSCSKRMPSPYNSLTRRSFFEISVDCGTQSLSPRDSCRKRTKPMAVSATKTKTAKIVRRGRRATVRPSRPKLSRRASSRVFDKRRIPLSDDTGGISSVGTEPSVAIVDRLAYACSPLGDYLVRYIQPRRQK
mmetsp:Transcript_14570/g.36074  ORF Transcript_14570/g.36074 Transcript_14570/m.36074 type:complete len:243 (-) Transcript_14570:35-763(-)